MKVLLSGDRQETAEDVGLALVYSKL